MSLLSRISPLTLALLLALPVAASAHSIRYTVTQVGALGSVANDINSSGAVVGNVEVSLTVTRAFANIGGVITDLGTLGGPASYASAINDSNVIVGTSINADGYRRAFRYEGGTMVDLGTLGGNNSAAGDINNRGDIAGSADIGPDPLDGRAFLLRPGVSMQDLGRIEVPDAEGTSSALGLNEHRQVVGGSVVGPYTPPESPYHAFLYKCEEMIDLGTLGGQYSVAHAINERGQVVGESATPDLHFNRAFLYYKGVMKNLGTLPDGEFSSANDINDHGQVVGFASGPAPDNDSTGWQHAFIWSSGKMRDLNKLIDPASGWVIVSAGGINNAGQIAATGCKGTNCYAVRLDPVP